MLLKLIYRFNKISTRIPANIFVGVDKFVLKFIRKDTGPGLAKIILTKKKKEDL